MFLFILAGARDQTADVELMCFCLCLQEPGVKQVTWNSSGPAVSKAISCAEIMKRKIKVQNVTVRSYQSPVSSAALLLFLT